MASFGAAAAPSCKILRGVGRAAAACDLRGVLSTKEASAAEGDDMKKTDLTVEILKDIREELRGTNERLEKLGDRLDARIDETNQRLDETNRRLVASEIRTATAITGDVHELTTFLRAQNDLRPRMDRCERDIAHLQTKARS
jgi:predicted  nucleic acid-binding Zn-ribbon protein